MIYVIFHGIRELLNMWCLEEVDPPLYIAANLISFLNVVGI